MAGLDGLTAQSLGSAKTVNWTWSIELITCAILIVWFLFYLNRLFATIVSYAVRAYTWHKFRVYIDIKALQISLLGGRIFFKGVRYHGENETVYIHHGYITWQYWLSTTRQVDLSSSDERSNGSTSSRTETSLNEKNEDSEAHAGEKRDGHGQRGTAKSRLLVSITGLEWFIYNRTPMYDAIVKEAGAQASSAAADVTTTRSAALSKVVETTLRTRRRTGDGSMQDAVDTSYTEKASRLRRMSRASISFIGNDRPSVSKEGHVQIDDSNTEPEIGFSHSLLLRMLPLALECSRGAVSLGNEHTRALVVTTFEKARGRVDAGSSGRADIFRQIFDFEVDHPMVQMKPNPDFNMPQIPAAERIIFGTDAVLKRKRWWQSNLNLHRRQRDVTQGLKNLIPHWRRSAESVRHKQVVPDGDRPYDTVIGVQPDSNSWHGLDRYMDEDDGDDHHAWIAIEYARFSTIFDCPRVSLRFYWDTPGVVQPTHILAASSGLAKDLNGIGPPAYGLHLDVGGGLVNYGPWADRLRGELQAVFLPASYKSASQTVPPSQGEYRLNTVMNITVNIEEEITLRVPSRENSKDWRWRGRATAVRDAAALRRQQQRKHFRFKRSTKRRRGPEVRPFGWLAISVGPRSTVRYTMDMFPGIDGYRNSLSLQLKSTKATSSVNHAILWECAEQVVVADLSNPLGWNDVHDWRFSVSSKSMDLYLLRDHTFLLLDLIADFTAGLESEYMTFIPFRYFINIDFANLQLFLNANDQNIVDSPTDQDENAYLVLGFARLAGQVEIPMEYFSPSQSTVKFKGNGQDAYFLLKTPAWNTLHAFCRNETTATLGTLELDGAYNYFAKTSHSLTDSLDLNIFGGKPHFVLQGYLIRYFMNVKENYFGENIHFCTLEEYQSRLDANEVSDANKTPPLPKVNDLDVMLSVAAEQASAIMPAGIYDRDEFLRIDLLLGEADMRFTNYYMDLQVSTSPIKVSTQKNSIVSDEERPKISECQLYLDGSTVYGHRLFGAPPTEPTYLCNWDLDVGEVTGECSTDFVRTMIASILSFIFAFDDDENALPAREVTVIPDVTFLRMRIGAIRTWILSAGTAFLLDVSPATIELSDWANKYFSQFVNVQVPSLLLASVDATSAHQMKNGSRIIADTSACFRTSLKVAVFGQKADFAEHRALQQEHIRLHDLRTHRTDWLLHKNELVTTPQHFRAWSRHPPAMPIPNMPAPMPPHGDRMPDVPDATNIRQRSSSFLAQGQAAYFNTPYKSETAEPVTCQEIVMEGLDDDRLSRTSKRTVINDHNTTTSPWIKPKFLLSNLYPDQAMMPVSSLDDIDSQYDPVAHGLNEKNREAPHEDHEHIGISCRFPNGIFGFVTRDFVGQAIKLVNSISPSGAATMLDDIQMQTVSTLKKLDTERPGKIDDIAIGFPKLHLRFVDIQEMCPQGSSRDVYDIALQQGRATVRLAPDPHKRSLKSRMLAGVTLKQIKVDVLGRHGQQSQHAAAANLEVSGIETWFSLYDSVKTQTHVSSVEISSRAQDIAGLARLAQRMEETVTQMIQDLDSIDLVKRERHLMYHLIQATEASNPVFLNRPAYVLRTAESHIRLQDSWKIVARLRDTLHSRAPNEFTNWSRRERCADESLRQINGSIKSTLETWRSSGTIQEDDLAVLRAIFDLDQVDDTRTNDYKKVQAEIKLGRIAVVLDSGDRRNQVALSRLRLDFTESSMDKSRFSWDTAKATHKRQIVGAYADSIEVCLQWELLELADMIIAPSEATRGSRKISSPKADVNEAQRGAIDMSIVLGVGEAVAELNSMNLRLLLVAENLKSCVTLLTSAQLKTHVSAIINADIGRSRLDTPGKAISSCKIVLPTICIESQRDPTKSSTPIAVFVVANCRALRFRTKDHVLGLVHLTGRILHDEVPVLKALLTKVNRATSNDTTVRTSRSQTLVQLHMALLLHNHRISLNLMPNLTYVLTGRVVRMSIVPYGQHQFSANLDLKKNEHTFLHPTARNAPDTSLLVPPLNSRLQVDLSDRKIRIAAHNAVEFAELDASALRACFDAAYTPETSTYVKNVKAEVSKIQALLRKSPSITPAEKSTDANLSDRVILYTAKVVSAGGQLSCGVPATRQGQHYHAVLCVRLGPLSGSIANHRAGANVTLKLPQYAFALQHIILEASRLEQPERNLGQLRLGLKISGHSVQDTDGDEVQHFSGFSDGCSVDMSLETAVLAVDILTAIERRIRNLSLTKETKRLRPLRRLTMSMPSPALSEQKSEQSSSHESPSGWLNSTFEVDLHAICVRWLSVSKTSQSDSSLMEDMAFTINRIELQTKRNASARLGITGLQLQLVPRHKNDPFERTSNSALLPEMVFNAAYGRASSTRKFAFKAAGKVVDIRLASNFIVPAAVVQKSLAIAANELRGIRRPDRDKKNVPLPTQSLKLLGNKRLESLQVFADFAGAKLTLTGAGEDPEERSTSFPMLKGSKMSRVGRYGQAVQVGPSQDATLRAPGIAFEIKFQDDGEIDPILSTEVKVAASSNTLAPSVVPLVLEISKNITSVLSQDDLNAGTTTKPKSASDKTAVASSLEQARDPIAILGRVKLNAGLWMQRQEFSLTCQPIARVSATAKFDEIFVVVNTVQAPNEDRFFSITTTFSNLSASVQHVYSRESTASFDVESIMISLMNSKHFSNKSGISAILDVSPMRAELNAKQMQDFLLFREIWYPPELRSVPRAPTSSRSDEAQSAIITRLQEATATSTVPWHAIVSVQELKVLIDFGQSISKSNFEMKKLWASSKKSESSEQNLCLGFDRIGIDSTGRMSGFVELQSLRIRTAIRWPRGDGSVRTPLVQGSIGFDHLRTKIAFDYQPFAVADVSMFSFLIYNVRQDASNDRLVGILDGGKVQVFVTAPAAAQVVSIYQAFERLIQEKQDAFRSSLGELEHHLRRASTFPASTPRTLHESEAELGVEKERMSRAPRLHVDVVISVATINSGVFPSTFFDDVTLKLEAVDVQAGFAVGDTGTRVHSGLSMSLGEVRLALSNMTRANAKALGEVSITEVVDRVTAARGGTILKVPRLVASMETWQELHSNIIEYIFHSTFHGKVDIGWNYSRISIIRHMWDTHSRALAQRVGKSLPESALKIRAEPKDEAAGQEKITAVVNMPQSKYEYIPLEPPVIDTPQLRDLGEATPSLEWVGLQRERLPHVTHSVIIVSLLGIAREVEDAYGRILGS